MSSNKGNKELKFQTIQLSVGEIQDAMKHRVHKSKKTYSRKNKHKGKGY